MKPSTLYLHGPILPAGVRDLVRHAGESLSVSLEVWASGGRHPERLSLATACAACEIDAPRLFDRCRKRRTYLARRDLAAAPALSEKCPLRLRLTRLANADAGVTLFAFGYSPGATDTQDERALSLLRDLERLLVENATQQIELDQMTDELASRYEEINLLYSLSGKLSRVDDLRTTVVNVLAEWRRVLEADCAIAWLRDRSLLEFSVAPPAGVPRRPEARSQWEAFARRIADTLARSGEEVVVERLGPQHPLSRQLGRDCDCIAVPLESEGRLRGIVAGLRRAGADFDTPEVRLLRSLAAQLGLAVANADLYDDLKGFLTATVKSLVAAIDAKDSYTSGHSERVNIVSMLLGNEMNLDLDELEALYWGSLLHDVGKIGMPESILNKPEVLEPEEIEIVKQHPERGWEMLHPIERLRRAAEGVRLHHERWDGQGYPLGLAGEAIPRIARIIAVADTFDAILSNRSYRKGQPAARALAVIESASGTQFDPAVVEPLRRLLPLLDKHQWLLMSGQKGSPP